MAVELAEVVAGFPAAASFAIAGGITALREGRRRSALNEAVHELRRPLQALALSLPADVEAAGGLDSSLRMAAAAVDRLEREINRKGAGECLAPMSLRPVVEAAVERWRVCAARARRPLRLSWSASEPRLRGDAVEVSQAVDNMISNALVHGAGEIVIEVREGEDCLCLLVRDGGPRNALPQAVSSGNLWRRLSGRSRHGHGLRVVRRVAAQHGGSFQLRRSSHRTEARLELPSAGGVR